MPSTAPVSVRNAGGASEKAPRYPVEALARRAIERRAFEAVVWGMPAVNFDLMFQAMAREVKGSWNQIVYWSGLARLEEPDTHAKPGFDLLHAVLQPRRTARS